MYNLFLLNLQWKTKSLPFSADINLAPDIDNLIRDLYSGIYHTVKVNENWDNLLDDIYLQLEDYYNDELIDTDEIKSYTYLTDQRDIYFSKRTSVPPETLPIIFSQLQLL